MGMLSFIVVMKAIALVNLAHHRMFNNNYKHFLLFRKRL